MRCSNCEAPVDVLDACQDCIEQKIKYGPKEESTHCKAGHLFTEDTTGWSAQGTTRERRYCLLCRRVRVNATREAERFRRKARREAARK